MHGIGTIIIPSTKVCSYSFIQAIPRFVIVSEVQKIVTGSNFETAGTDPSSDTIRMIHFHIIQISAPRFHKWLFSVKFRFLFSLSL
jgi:hypothetical protein